MDHAERHRLHALVGLLQDDSIGYGAIADPGLGESIDRHRRALLDGIDALLAEVERLRAELQAARAAHALPHLYEGNCPDETQPGSRDPMCPACRAMGPAQGEGAASRIASPRWRLA